MSKYPNELWKATHVQTKEVKKGTWEELCDLDKRQWELRLINHTPKSHARDLQPEVLAIIRTYLRAPTHFYCVPGIYQMPIYSLNDLTRQE